MLGNPSTWVTAAFVLVGIAAAMFGTLAPAAVVLSFMSMASVAAVIAAPLAVIFPIWLIWKDFKACEIGSFTRQLRINAQSKCATSSNVKDMADRVNSLFAFRTEPYTFFTYLRELPRRFWKWAGDHKGQATVVALGILAAVAIVFLLVFGSGLGPVAATVGFLSQLFSSAFMGIGAGVGTLVPAVALPVVSTTAVAISQAATVLASAVLVALPLVIADNVRRIASTLEELPKGWWRLGGNQQDYQLLPNNDEDVDPTATTKGSVNNSDKTVKSSNHGGQGPNPAAFGISPPPTTPAAPPFAAPPHDAPPPPVVVTSPPGAPTGGAPTPNPGGP